MNENISTKPYVVFLHPVTFQKQIAEIDKKIQKAMAKTDNPVNKYDRIPSEFQEKIDNIEADIKRLIQRAEYLGDVGKIDESEAVNEEIQSLKRAKEDLVTRAENPNLVAKQMKICDICGAMQAANDTETRNITHLEGKLHTGFLKLRGELEKLKKRKDVLKLQASTNRALRREEYRSRHEEPVSSRIEPVERRRTSPQREDKDDRKKDKERKRSRDRERSRDRSRDKHREKDRKKRDESGSAERKKKHKKDKDKKGRRSRS